MSTQAALQMDIILAATIQERLVTVTTEVRRIPGPLIRIPVLPIPVGAIHAVVTAAVVAGIERYR